MLVKMRTAMAGPKGTAKPGDVVQVDDTAGADWIKLGFAEEAPSGSRGEAAAEVPETATKAPKETATGRNQRNK